VVGTRNCANTNAHARMRANVPTSTPALSHTSILCHPPVPRQQARAARRRGSSTRGAHRELAIMERLAGAAAAAATTASATTAVAASGGHGLGVGDVALAPVEGLFSRRDGTAFNTAAATAGAAPRSQLLSSDTAWLLVDALSALVTGAVATSTTVRWWVEDGASPKVGQNVLP
jgi:hypothetical protein